MKIPKRFHLMGQVYTVRILKQSDWKDPEAVGLFDNASRQILILKADPPTMQQVFLHEAEHAILLAMGRDDLYKDEAFVDLHAGLLHQLLTSAE
ncbi:MAG TPA: hypothetical protein VJQ82_21710 [Terriglobales bacterium]|nr:hypothetical protein [Terriglobales bacterium]